ncbi:MAG: phosphoenolpyruvate--protein phosphotransferase [Mariprofundaceae bacterium]|nr:phosphoenolpyruvate--protein phosphotransferase [Mariprofundaceae bacterium]
MSMYRMNGHAIASSHGIVIGQIQKVNVGSPNIPEYIVNMEDVEGEKRRLEQAAQAALQELTVEYEYALSLQQQDPVLILDAHRMLLKDPDLIEYPKSLIQHQSINAEWALKQQVENITATFDGMHDSYLRSKRLDIEQVGERLMRHLLACPFQVDIQAQDKPVVVVTHDVSPADMMRLSRSGVAGIICEQGSLNAHAIIMARGIGMPALMGVDMDLSRVSDGMSIILDAERDYWQLSPTPEEEQRYQRFIDSFEVIRQSLKQFSSKPSLSQDGVSLPLYANIDCADDVNVARQMGAEAIGLCRTEFIFLNHQQEPIEQEQFRHYSQMLQDANGLMVTFRLLDIGGDKAALFQSISGHAYQADNPNLGLRGVRLLLQSPTVLEVQLRALLRASHHGNIRILVPMVTQCEEMAQVRHMMLRCCEELGVKPVPLGCMIEVPAAVMMVDDLACLSDFLAIGSNDLTQYTFAADRGDEEVAHYYQEGHPIIFSMIERVLRAAHEQGLKVCLCGELASNPDFTQAFLDMGMDALSMSLHSILPVRRHLSRLKRDEHGVSLV